MKTTRPIPRQSSRKRLERGRMSLVADPARIWPRLLRICSKPGDFGSIAAILLTACAALIAHSLNPLPLQAESSDRPNIVLIMADDLGYSDLGCYGGEIETPELDALAAGGLQFTQFYNTARCWPTRAALLTGYYAQQVRRDKVEGVPSGGRGTRPDWAPLLPRMLQPLGYRAYHSGKWHLDGMPLASGFDRSYYLRDQGRFFHPKVHWKDDKKLPPVPPDSGYYGTNAIADHAVECLKQHAKQHANQPFFHYLAFTAPHFPLHALPEDIAHYRQRYLQGWDASRQARWKRQQEKQLVSGRLAPSETDVGPPYHFPEALEKLGPGEINRPLPWKQLSDEQREFQATKMAIHAAMVHRMDIGIGKVLRQIRSMKQWDNTLILFLSDNGASAEIMVRDDGHDPQAAPGSAASYLCLGPGWSTTANTPFRRHKTWVHEGGIATPLIAHWPKGIPHRGQLRENVGHVIDIVPTILAAAGGEVPTRVAGQAVPPPPGKSLLPVFRKDHTVTREFLWWSHEGNQAIRVGDWKLVRAAEDRVGKGWELYNLAEDRSETRDLASQMPDRVRQLAELWQQHTASAEALARRDLKPE